MKLLLKSLIILFLLASCSPDEDYSFEESQSKIVKKFRTEGYYEYNSRLNDILLAELNSLETGILCSETLETISDLSEKVKKEKNTTGCYLIGWESSKSDPLDKNAITLEWNSKHGVIIRMFTKSSLIQQRLPLNSY
ncbi:hypothetical protein J2X31_003535 [Flavobacterium arsenatis]|uniref:Lipoprotein n=1 Tax=Flavobacterium arsenatis TaxID=1484332 RepID=A0ABU1TUE9_9FLAO|nr:hypothetical protein [Flavobacterium arsenatis]MDR6969502.1 hypothetical protein [Flavobacterium arsenatis]